MSQNVMTRVVVQLLTKNSKFLETFLLKGGLNN